eukprot:PITA_02888
MYPSWLMVAIGANGMSGGLAALWDPTWIKARAFKCCAGIMISGSVRGHANILNLLNVYGPCRNRSPFWERLFASDILEMDSLLLAGDMNFTLIQDECWGNGRKKDPLSDRIFLEDSTFNDVISKKWRALDGSEVDGHLSFREKIHILKSIAKEWQHQKVSMDKQELTRIQQVMDALSTSSPNLMSLDKRRTLRALEKRKQHLPFIEEASWRLKSRALWLKHGDRNTKIFQNIANARKRRNAIWKIDDSRGG